MNSNESKITRRDMIQRTAGATAVVAAGRLGLQAMVEAAEAESKPTIWDMHAHMTGVTGTPEERVVKLLEYADRVGVEKVVFFLGFDRSHNPPPAQLRIDNDELLRGIGKAPDRTFGFVYMNPNYVEESIKEFDRCVVNGPMVGVKLWVACRCNDKRLDPLVEHAAKYKAPILQHVWTKTTGNLPGESTPSELAELAARHPQATFIAAHVGGNWELGIRAIRAVKNVTAGLSGSDPTAGMVEMAVRELGADRVMYGSDYGGRSLASQIAKVTGAEVSPADKRLILSENLRRMLTPICKAKGIKI